MVSAKILCHNTFFMQGFISVVGINNERGNESKMIGREQQDGINCSMSVNGMINELLS